MYKQQIRGAGGAMLIPTASDDLLGTGMLSLGPTAVLLKQKDHWTVGGLANHLWSVTGESDRDEVDATYFEPWVSDTTDDQTTYSLDLQSQYDWQSNELSLPVIFSVDQLFKVDEQFINVSAGVRYWAASPDDGPEGFGFQFQLTYLFPTK